MLCSPLQCAVKSFTVCCVVLYSVLCSDMTACSKADRHIHGVLRSAVACRWGEVGA